MKKYLSGWNALPAWEIPKAFVPTTLVSILIPARNESENIVNCLQSILRQNYPTELFEIIVIDDHSTDETVALVEQLNHPQVKLLKLAEHLAVNETTRSFKKKAIEKAIGLSSGQLIVTTDADCIVPSNWLRYLVSYYQDKKVKFIAAPVNFFRENALVEYFQSLDFVGMMGITGGGIQSGLMNMCNGANLAYEKKVFHEVNGFEGIDHVASGDDMMLMQKIARIYPEKIGFVKNPLATVLTPAKSSWKGFLRQRIRWASKSASYEEWRVTLILALVFFFCLSILSSLILIPIWGPVMIAVLFLQISIKALADYLLLNEMSQFFKREALMQFFWPAFFLHTAYIIVVGILGNLIKNYEWKGRRVH